MNIQEKLTTIADNVPKVYAAGVAEGRVSLMAQYQDYGNRRNYAFAFSAWTDDMPSPLYDIVCDNSSQSAQIFPNSKLTDVAKWIGDKQIDISGANNLSNFCANSQISSLPSLDMSNITNATLAFYNMVNLTSLTLLNVNPNCIWDRTFNYSKMEGLVITGTIGKTITFLHNYYLNKESVINIVGCLSSTTSDLTITFNKYTVDKRFETSAGAGDGSNSAEWQALVATKPNWNIALG